jgi:hypothetical protein
VPDARLGDLDRMRNPCFAVIGTSAAELSVVYRALAGQPDLVCHGQLFHPERIEFAASRQSAAGYGADDVRLREVARANFLADIVRAETRGLTGFMLCADQGGDLSGAIFERPNIRVVIVRGDPMVAFTESLLASRPLLDQRFDPAVIESIAADDLADRFWRFVGEFRQQTERLAALAAKSGATKPKGWVREVDLSRARTTATRAALSGATIDWATPLEQCLGIDLDAMQQDGAAAAVAAGVAQLESLRVLVAARLTASGITGIGFEPVQPAGRVAGKSRWDDERKLAHAGD